MRTRDPNSKNQLLMTALFGKKQAAEMPSHWTEWPEPQRSIYSRMWNLGIDVVKKSPKPKVLDNDPWATDRWHAVHCTRESFF